MDFSEALKLLKEGKKLRRRKWRHIYMKLRRPVDDKDYRFSKHRISDGFERDTVELGAYDIAADDWEVVE